MLAFPVRSVEADGIIYIRADGSVDPVTACITSSDNVTYTLTDEIYEGIVVERDGIVVDGKGYTVQGAGNGTAIDLSGRTNVTVKNAEIRFFETGILLDNSSRNTVSANNVTDCEFGIALRSSSSQNTFRNNQAKDNRYNLGIFTALTSGYIQDIDDSNTVNGKPVYYWINRSDMTVPLDAGYVVLVNCTRITVRNLNLTNNMQGVALSLTTNSMISNNRVMNNFDSIRFDHSSNNNVISGNNITANTCYGIRLFCDASASGSQLAGPSCNSTICGNNVTENGTGIRFDYPSNNTVYANNVAYNSDGIGFYGSSSGNTVFENNITNSIYGIWFHSSYGNRIFNNNFVNNTQHAYPYMDLNFWDAGYPSGGNYWSGRLYVGNDTYSGLYQNETGSDGIRDAPLGSDKYPLMGLFNSYNVTYYTPPTVSHACNVTLISNSTVSSFAAPIWDEHSKAIFLKFNVSGEEGSAGFCRLSFPTAMMNGTYHVSLNGTEIPYTLLPCSDANTSYLHFAYTHSTQEVIIVPESPSFLILPLFMIATLLGVIASRGRRKTYAQP
jgi:parallel beta-helix repeat protein